MSSDSVELQAKPQLRVDRLRQIREIRGLTQHELARECGIGINQITRYENGLTEPSASVLATIVDKLGVSADYLLGLSDSPLGRDSQALSPESRTLLEAFELGDHATVLELVTAKMRAASEAEE